MDEQGKAQIQVLGAGLLGFGLVVGLGSYFVVPHGLTAPASIAARGEQPLFAPAPARPVDAAPPTAGVSASAAAAASSPAPLLSDEFRPDMSPAAANSAAPSSVAAGAAAANGSSSAPAAPRLIATAPLGASGSAAVSAAAVPAPTGKPGASSAAAASNAKSAAVVAANRAVAAAVVHYGVSDRAQLMERGAGPVYNFGSLGEKGDPIAGAVRQVDAAQQQVNAASGASDADKSALGQNANQIREVAYQADQAVQQATVQAGAAGSR